MPFSSPYSWRIRQFTAKYPPSKYHPDFLGNFFNHLLEIWELLWGTIWIFNENEKFLTKFLWSTIWIFQRKWENFDKIPMGYHMNLDSLKKSYGVPYELSMKLGNFPQTCILVYLLLIHIRKFSNKMQIFAKYPPPEIFQNVD